VAKSCMMKHSDSNFKMRHVYSVNCRTINYCCYIVCVMTRTSLPVAIACTRCLSVVSLVIFSRKFLE